MAAQNTPGAYIRDAQRAHLNQYQPVNPSIRQSIRQEITGHNVTGSEAPESLGQAASNTSKRYAGRGNEFLRSLRFGFIRQRFSSGSFWGRKTTAVLFMFPVMASMCIGATQMVTQSFLVYLKY